MKRSLAKRRTALRYPLTGRAEFHLPHRDLTISGSLEDLSKSGVSILVTNSTERFMTGELGMLTIQSPDLPDFVTCFVTIARLIPLTGGLKLGLDFMSIDDENHAKVTAYLGLARARSHINQSTGSEDAD
jgi:hypothetical protein